MESLNSKKATNHFNYFDHVKIEHLIAGISGGVISTVVLHPLDVIKIRFAATDNRHLTQSYKGILNAFSTIVHREGFSGLYKGVTPNIWGAGSAWGLYFLFYNAFKGSAQNGNKDTALSPAQHLIAASEAGCFTLLLTNPLWVVKTRMCLQFANPSEKTLVYTGMFNALKKIYVQEGLRGYYKGLVPGIFGVSHGAIQFMIYEEMKKKCNQYQGQSITKKLGTFEYLTFAALSKLCAVSVTYPYQVVRIRLQNQHYSYTSARDCISQTWKYEGWRGFYKGLGTNLLRVTPATMITFLTYENVSHFLARKL